MKSRAGGAFMVLVIGVMIYFATQAKPPYYLPW